MRIAALSKSCIGNHVSTKDPTACKLETSAQTVQLSVTGQAYPYKSSAACHRQRSSLPSEPRLISRSASSVLLSMRPSLVLQCHFTAVTGSLHTGHQRLPSFSYKMTALQPVANWHCSSLVYNVSLPMCVGYCAAETKHSCSCKDSANCLHGVFQVNSDDMQSTKTH